MRKPLSLLVLALTLAKPTAAEPAPRESKDPPSKPAPKAPPLKKADFDRLGKSLQSGNESETLASLNEIRARGRAGAAAAPLVEALLLRGSSASILVAALETAGALGAESSSTQVALYVQHRNPLIRRAAASALGHTRGPVATATLRRALGSGDPLLRSIAAELLGELGAVDAVSDLFTVLSHDTPEAALSIAKLCLPADCDRLMGLVGKLKFETLEPAFVPLLTRAPSQVPEAHQVRYVDRLSRMATPSARAALTVALSKLPQSASPKLRRTLEAASKGRPVPKEAP